MFRASFLPIIMAFSTVHSALLSFIQVLDDRFQAESWWNCRAVPPWPCLEAVIKNSHETYRCRMYSRKLRDDGQRRCPKHIEFYNRINLDNRWVWLVVQKENLHNNWHGVTDIWQPVVPFVLKNASSTLHLQSQSFDVEYIYGFVWWGVCKQSRWRHSVTEPSEDSGYVLLWQRYDNNKMVAIRYYGNVSFCCWRCVYWACYRCILHLQQYSHRLNLYYFLLTKNLSPYL